MKNKSFIILLLLATVTFLGSCLKDDVGEYWKDDLKGKMYATIYQDGFHAMAIKPVAKDYYFTFMINIATDALPGSDIEVTLDVDKAALDAYNLRTSKSYLLYPNIQIMNPKQVIKAGTRNAYITVKVWGAEALNACDNYIAPISIISVSDPKVIISSNAKSYLMALPISNPYEGTYKCTGVFSHPTAGNRDIDADKILKTVDCKTVSTTVGDLGGYEVTFTVNANNTVTVGGAGLGATQPIVQDSDPAYNKYDPATKTFTVKYYYVGGGGNRVITETYVRK